MSESVDHPAHYGGADDPYEAIKVIEAWRLGFNLGNAVKYVCRFDRKGDPIENLEKARWFLDREIANRKSARAAAPAWVREKTRDELAAAATNAAQDLARYDREHA